MGTIQIDDGTREYALVDTYGREFCKIYFRPTDISIMDRYNELTADFDSVIAPLKDVGIKADGTGETDADWAKVKAAEAEIIRRIGAVLDTDVSAIFARRNAFSAIGGRFFCEVVLDAIGREIAAAISAETEASAARMAKYLPEDTADAGAASAGA